MKKFQCIGIVAIMIFSFIYTEKIANLTLEKNEIYQDIENNSEYYNVSSVNASIDENNIIPGLNGKKVNIKNSYFNMKDLNVFNSYYLKYETTYPDVTIDNNKDKIVKQGNSLKNAVAFVFPYKEEFIDVFKSMNLDASVLVDMNTFKKDEKLEQINNEIEKYNNLESLLNKYKINSNICYLRNENEQICRNEKKYLVKTNNLVNNASFLQIKNNIQSGNIYYLDEHLNVSNLKVLINSIIYKDLDIVRLSKLLSEERD